MLCYIGRIHITSEVVSPELELEAFPLRITILQDIGRPLCGEVVSGIGTTRRWRWRWRYGFQCATGRAAITIDHVAVVAFLAELEHTVPANRNRGRRWSFLAVAGGKNY
jgi:hypothetical protein